MYLATGRALLLPIFVLLATVLFGCRSESEDEAGLDDEPVPTAAAVMPSSSFSSEMKFRSLPSDIVAAEVSLAMNYRSLAELSRDSTLIVVGTAIDTTHAVHIDVPVTLVRFSVETTVTGNGPNVTELMVVEAGGPMLGPNKSDGQPGEPREIAFSGVPVMRTGERWLLFLQPYQRPIIDDGFGIVGGIQGKFPIVDGVIAFSALPDRLDADDLAVVQDQAGRAVDAVIADVLDPKSDTSQITPRSTLPVETAQPHNSMDPSLYPTVTQSP